MPTDDIAALLDRAGVQVGEDELVRWRANLELYVAHLAQLRQVSADDAEPAFAFAAAWPAQA